HCARELRQRGVPRRTPRTRSEEAHRPSAAAWPAVLGDPRRSQRARRPAIRTRPRRRCAGARPLLRRLDALARAALRRRARSTAGGCRAQDLSRARWRRAPAAPACRHDHVGLAQAWSRKMKMRKLRRDRLTQDYDAHALFTFAVVPKWPRIANIAARLRRGLVIAFSETWLAVWLFRAKNLALAAHIPLLPVTLDPLSRTSFHVYLGH